MRKLFRCIIIGSLLLVPLALPGCGGSGNRVVEETGEMTFDQLAAEAAKETEAAEKAAESAGQ